MKASDIMTTRVDTARADATVAVNQSSFGSHYDGTSGITVDGSPGLISINGSL